MQDFTVGQGQASGEDKASMPALSKPSRGHVGAGGRGLELCHLLVIGAKVQRKQWGASTQVRAESSLELSSCKPLLTQGVLPRRLGPEMSPSM